MQQQEWNTTKVLSPNKYVATLNNNRHLPGTTIVPLGKIQYHRLHRGVKLSARILEVQVEMEVVVVVVDGVAAAVVVEDQVVAGNIEATIGENNMYQNTKTKLITIVILFITLLHYFIISMVLWSIFVLENCFFKNFTSFFFTYDRIYFLNIFVFF